MSKLDMSIIGQRNANGNDSVRMCVVILAIFVYLEPAKTRVFFLYQK